MNSLERTSQTPWRVLIVGMLWLAGTTPPAFAQGTLVNGENHTGGISSAGQVHEWTFTAAQGDAISVGIGELGGDSLFVPWIRLRRPDGTQIASEWGAVAARIHVAAAPLSGTYTVAVAGLNTNTGDYALTLAQAPGTFVVPAGDQGGELTNGANHAGTIHAGDLDQWSFTAAKGDAITVSIGEVKQGEVDPGFTPLIWLRGPDGAQLDLQWGALGGRIHVLAAPLSGTYTVVVAALNHIAVEGHYLLTLARSPGAFVVPTGDAAGPMTNGANHAGTIHVGDLDQWSFTAAKGDGITISIGEVLPGEVDPGFTPLIWLRGPDGAQLDLQWGALGGRIHVPAAPLSGTYTVVVAALNHIAVEGHYLVTLAMSPGAFVVPTGDAGGPMTNGANHAGTIHTGDLDQWTFHAVQGAPLAVSIHEVLVGEVDPGFTPLIWLRGPNGMQLDLAWGALTTSIGVSAAPLSGTYTVVVAALNHIVATGHYTLSVTGASVCAPTISPTAISAPAAGSTGAIVVSAIPTCAWTAQSNAPWVFVTAGAIGAGNGTVGYSVAANATTTPRSGTMTVAGHTFTVTQAAPAATFTVTPTAGANGSIAPGSPQTVTAGATAAFILTPAAGHAIGGVGGTCGGTLVGSVFTTLPIATHCSVVASFVVLSPSTTDEDGDGLPDEWETRFGLATDSASGENSASGDPDDDGRSNLQELQQGTHPRGFVITYLAEGATGAFFDTRLALANPSQTTALVLIRYQKGTGEVIPQYLTMAPMSRTTIDVGTLSGLEAAEFSTLVEADVQIVADRTLTWDDRGYGSHAERGILADAATTWYFAEGATHSGFELFYLIQNPSDSPAIAEITYLRPAPAPALVKTYPIGPQSRFNVWVNDEARVDPALAVLAATDISTVIRSANGVPLVAERAMYLHGDGLTFAAGHESAGVTALSPTWFFAEGATGAFFDLFLLIGNPGVQDAIVQATYLLPSGTTLTRSYTVPARSRFNIWVDLEDPLLADTAVSTTLTSLNGVPVVAERAMWWPGQPIASRWYEAHNSPGATSTGIRWALAEGETGGPRGMETYVLIANTSSFAGQARVTLLFEDGTTASDTFPLTANSRFNVEMRSMFPASEGRRYGALVESLGATPAQIVVERAMYADALGLQWAAGTNALATKLP